MLLQLLLLLGVVRTPWTYQISFFRAKFTGITHMGRSWFEVEPIPGRPHFTGDLLVMECSGRLNEHLERDNLRRWAIQLIHEMGLSPYSFPHNTVHALISVGGEGRWVTGSVLTIQLQETGACKQTLPHTSQLLVFPIQSWCISFGPIWGLFSSKRLNSLNHSSTKTFPWMLQPPAPAKTHSRALLPGGESIWTAICCQNRSENKTQFS